MTQDNIVRVFYEIIIEKFVEKKEEIKEQRRFQC